MAVVRLAQALAVVRACACVLTEQVPPPQPLLRGLHDTPSVSEIHEVDGRTVYLRALHDELQLTYVHDLVCDEEIAELIAIADARNGWGRSPLKSQNGEDCTEDDLRRTSSSCPMLWPQMYGEEQVAARPDLASELRLTERISGRVAKLFSATGFPLTPDYIEPLQLVRYQPGERFAPHHDYHEVAESSIQGEQRAFTVLIFGSTFSSTDDGGETHFPHLGVSVWPRKGDALVWSNVDDEGEPNPRSQHEGRPPVNGVKVAINCWIANTPYDVSRGLRKSALISNSRA